MKLTDFYFFEPLNDLRTRMGIGQDVYGTLTVLIHPGRLTPSELEKLSSEEGLEIESLDDIKVLDDGTLALKDRRVLLYIRDISSYQGKPVQPPRFHLVNCDVLQKMRSRNRLYRYVVAVAYRKYKRLGSLAQRSATHLAAPALTAVVIVDR